MALAVTTPRCHAISSPARSKSRRRLKWAAVPADYFANLNYYRHVAPKKK
jgi:hypothetical protein